MVRRYGHIEARFSTAWLINREIKIFGELGGFADADLPGSWDFRSSSCGILGSHPGGTGEV
jgi:hypothetical protein